MKVRIAPITLIALLSASSFACDKSSGVTERQKETPTSEEARNAAIEAQRQAQGGQAAAEKTLSAARADFEATRENYLHTRRLDLVDLDKRIADLEASARTATGKTKANLRARLPAIRSQRDAFDRNVLSMEAATPATWDAATASLDKQGDALKKAVSDTE